MSRVRHGLLGACFALLTFAPVAAAAQKPTPPPATVRADEAARLAAEVRRETQRAWGDYKRYAWGHDALKPLSRTPHDWYAHSLLMTPVDALDTLHMMGLKAEADEARELIAERLRFDHDIDVKVFEVTIRLLGGLVSGYQTTGDKRLLVKAQELADRMLPAFDTPTGMPWRYVNLKTGKLRDPLSNPAETGTLLLEFGMLSKLTGKPVYYDTAKRALVATFKARSPLGLVGSTIDVRTGQWTNSDSHISGGVDSYYEYLWKCWRLFGDADCKAMWDASIGPMNRYLADERGGALWYGHADMNSGKRGQTIYGALDAFLPGLLALAGDRHRAERLQRSGMAMWRQYGIEPEEYDYVAGQAVSYGYPLRPEIVESAWYLHRLTGDPEWRAMGAEMWRDFVKHTKQPVGFAAIDDVRTMKPKDEMESFVFAETFKYYWLLFSPDAVFDFDAMTFNTEAHPFRLPAARKK